MHRSHTNIFIYEYISPQLIEQQYIVSSCAGTNVNKQTKKSAHTFARLAINKCRLNLPLCRFYSFHASIVYIMIILYVISFTYILIFVQMVRLMNEAHFYFLTRNNNSIFFLICMYIFIYVYIFNIVFIYILTIY